MAFVQRITQSGRVLGLTTPSVRFLGMLASDLLCASYFPSCHSADPKPAQALPAVPSPALPLTWQSCPGAGNHPDFLPFSSPTYLDGHLLVLRRQPVQSKVLLPLGLLSLHPRLASFLITFPCQPFVSVTSASLVRLPPLA